ncbi:hypothetical protein [Microbacterium sp. NPDC056234]|uniref:hypothetical protein n=1 Tax=Microbacterium sp. NPDC056234 TaxID=3345757 RepID=UPI0035D958A7
MAFGYTRRDSAEPIADAVGYRQHGIWVSPDELQELMTGLRNAILPVLSNEATPERSRYLLSPILFPSESQ